MPRLKTLDDLMLTIPLTDFLELDPATAGRLVEARYETLRAAGCDAEAAVIGAVHPEAEIKDVVNLSRRKLSPRMMIAILLDRPIAELPRRGRGGNSRRASACDTER